MNCGIALNPGHPGILQNSFLRDELRGFRPAFEVFRTLSGRAPIQICALKAISQMAQQLRGPRIGHDRAGKGLIPDSLFLKKASCL